ncbi:MAG: hypothetical protein HW387_1011 [Parachlamydiales bacterium]|nr:hypothetical protein [Parachlamydiales bacterium]
MNSTRPIQFSIPEEKIVTEIPCKDFSFAPLIPSQLSTYIYNSEGSYYRDYQRSYYAVTCRKGGWDCLRHYEILANGCIPYFVNLPKCPPKTLTFFPKELVLEGMNMAGISYPEIDFQQFDTSKYKKIVAELLEFTRKHLTTKKIAQYLLEELQYSKSGTILYLSGELYPNYLHNLTLIGLKQLLGPRVVDFPKVEHLYNSYSKPIDSLYGKGFTYSKIIDDEPVDREQIETRIQKREFDLVIYGDIHRGSPYYYYVRRYYQPEQIVFLCGKDTHTCQPLPNLFIRESDSF